ncbi:hypothetical protein PTSG_03747 [Salpingoeca rosetta]|uniref:Uncharacterized protein n=1 Tax=Salpingoeca rosetta (strain ATCC 50818 / BSB-021) TaxID=946362 RepID=F2U6G5_SALR5|nr:uncharacterized protein PTSG_03747 [Salpingoeca rosetta]EGD83106.1 hypothetical protein PTSG_03747 [Salpingoeca rosetta]|eukprot:XP_004995470.1 hypothetical protein PTSG_03747 [Salpingoeca rosetta]
MNALEAAKQGRKEQLDRLEKYLAGEPTVFVNHQGKELEFTYDPAQLTKDRDAVKVDFEATPVFLSTAADASLTNEIDELQELIDQGADVNSSNAEGVTALHTACIEGSVKVATLLVRSGAHVNARDMDWWTPLHTAAACGQWRIARLLINNGADLRAVTADGELAIDLADEDKVRDLLLAEMEKAGISEGEHEQLKSKPADDFMEYVSSVIEKGNDINEPDADGATLVHVAACNGWIEPLKLLIAKGADVNAQDQELNTPLHYAAFFQQYKVVSELAKAKADPHKLNRHKEPPLHMTEDPTMIRAINAIESPSKDNKAEDLQEMRPRSASTIKRKTISRADIKKVEAKQEAKLAESMYAEIRFNEKPRRESEWVERDKRVHYEPVVYATLEFAGSSSKPPAPLAESVSSETGGNTNNDANTGSSGDGSKKNQNEGANGASAHATAAKPGANDAGADYADIDMEGTSSSSETAKKGCCTLL